MNYKRGAEKQKQKQDSCNSKPDKERSPLLLNVKGLNFLNKSKSSQRLKCQFLHIL